MAGLFRGCFMAKKKWIQEAIKKPGSFTRQAKQAGKSVSAFANEVTANPSRFSPTTVRRARLAKTLKKLSKKK